MEIVKTGDLERIKYERTEDVVVAMLFTKIYGVGEWYLFKPEPSLILSIGPILARQWYLEGLRTLDDVRDRKNGIKLSPHQEVRVDSSRSVLLGGFVLTDGFHSLKLGLKYYDGRVPTVQHAMQRLITALEDLNSRMPRDEARDIFERIKEIGRSPHDSLQ